MPSAELTRPHNGSPGEAELVERLRDGDEDAFADLVSRHNSNLLRIAQSIVGSRAVAEEVVQETWVAVLSQIDRFEGRSTLKTWIFRILVNRARTRGAQERRTVAFSSLAPDEEAESSVDPDRFTADGAWCIPPRPFDEPERRALLRELRGELREAFDALPDRQRLVVGLRDVDGFSREEVCELLDLTPGNQRVLLHRGRAKLRDALERGVERASA